MFDVEDLALAVGISSADVKAITPEVIANTFEEIVHKKCVWAQFYRVNRDILNKPGRKVVFPTASSSGAFSVGLAEFADVSTIGSGTSVGISSYSGTTIGVKKIAGFFNVTREAIKFAMRDVIKDNIYEVGLLYKERIDDVAYYQLIHHTNTLPAEQSTIVPNDSKAAMNMGTTNIWQITRVGPTAMGTTIQSSLRGIDYVGGTLYLAQSIPTATTVFFRSAFKDYSAVHAAKPGNGTWNVTAWGLLQAKAALIAEGRDPDAAVLNYADLPYLLYDNKVSFLDASAYGGREPLMNAEVGRLWGLKIITESRRLPEGAAVIIDTSRMGYDVHKEELRSYRDDRYERDAVFYYFYAERGFGVTDTLAVCLVMGGTSSYDSTHPTS